MLTFSNTFNNKCSMTWIVRYCIYHKQLPQHDPSLQMAYIPNSISHTVHTHNSTHHSELNTSWSVEPAEGMLSVIELTITSDTQHLRSCPFHWYLSSWCDVVVIINEITWHSKVSNLVMYHICKKFQKRKSFVDFIDDHSITNFSS